MKNPIIRFLSYFAYIISIGYIVFKGTEYQKYLEKIKLETYHAYPEMVFLSLFPAIYFSPIVSYMPQTFVNSMLMYSMFPQSLSGIIFGYLLINVIDKEFKDTMCVPNERFDFRRKL